MFVFHELARWTPSPSECYAGWYAWIPINNMNGDGADLRCRIERKITYPPLYKTLLNGECGVMPDIVKLITPARLTKYNLQLGIHIPKLQANLIP